MCYEGQERRDLITRYLRDQVAQLLELHPRALAGVTREMAEAMLMQLAGDGGALREPSNKIEIQSRRLPEG